MTFEYEPAWLADRVATRSPVDDDFDPEERARLLAALDDGIEDCERGHPMDGFDFIAQMRAKREAAGRKARITAGRQDLSVVGGESPRPR